jgi:hypothetical protein
MLTQLGDLHPRLYAKEGEHLGRMSPAAERAVVGGSIRRVHDRPYCGRDIDLLD